MRAKVFCAVVAFALCLLWAEPSVFGAEKQEQDRIQKELYRLANVVQQLAETQEGMRSLFDSQANKLQSLYAKNQASPFVSQGELREAFLDMNATLISHFRSYDESLDSLKSAIKSLGGLIQKTDEGYQQRFRDLDAQFESLQQALVEQRAQMVVQEHKDLNTTRVAHNETNITTPASDLNATTKNETKNVALDSLANGVVFSDGITFFNKGELDKSRQYLEHALAKQYKPATSLFYLGEIAYQQKRYADAIAHYKNSATRYDKADYIPILLLHSADCFEKIGDKTNAKTFLELLIEAYPKSKQAIEGKKKLAQLK
ncbi:MAG: tetratricopeptide repeat protein [Helicobacter sp.]|nr:tetratricopeptide repeat protein [Helicobacter sp.]